MDLLDTATGLKIADPEAIPLAGYRLNREKLKQASSALILSSSGWRKIFAGDGDQESNTDVLQREDMFLVALMALAYYQVLMSKVEETHAPPCLALGMDSRFTGPAIADIMLRVFLAKGLGVRFLFIVAIPELLAFVKSNPEIDGFVYVSASHNPIGHNGVKFGFADGTVAGGETSSLLIKTFQDLLATREPPDIVSLIESVPPQSLRETYGNIRKWKKSAETIYQRFTFSVAFDEQDTGQISAKKKAMRSNAKKYELGILADFNGGARTLSTDGATLGDVGITFHSVNAVPRQIAHRIVPEGESLELCRGELKKLHTINPAFTIGYVTDNDGDRGNLVIFDRNNQEARILQAQEVFALACIAELGYLHGRQHKFPERRKPVAVAINGPTSMRIESIAKIFGVQVFRCEVGEANVVSLAEKLRSRGFHVRILGEGSNGGTIIYPAGVRDPLNTLFSAAKLLLLRDTGGEEGIFGRWCRLSGQEDVYRPDFDIADVVATIPRFTTTGAYEDRAILQLGRVNHGLLKAQYEKTFKNQWRKNSAWLSEQYDLWDWEVINYEGTEERPGIGNRDHLGDQSGGLTVLLKDRKGLPQAFLWMRGSKTEPVFRILVDVRGDNPAKENYLLDWQRQMLLQSVRES